MRALSGSGCTGLRYGCLAIPLSMLLALQPIAAQGSPPISSQSQQIDQPHKPHPHRVENRTSFQPFTGKVCGNKVRMRTEPHIDGVLVAELQKGEYLIVDGEEGDFFAVRPPSHFRGYAFAGFIIDDVVEADRVHIRLAPNREATIIGYLKAGERVEAEPVEQDHKWKGIPIPDRIHFFVSKDFIKFAGDIHLKAIQEKREGDVSRLFETAQAFKESELRKGFREIDITRIKESYEKIIDQYGDFTRYVAQAREALRNVQEEYLKRQVAFLEGVLDHAQEDHPALTTPSQSVDPGVVSNQALSIGRVWEPIEEALYLAWAGKKISSRTIDQFYREQKLTSTRLTGVIKPYTSSAKNKPGDYQLFDPSLEIPICYIYSTRVDLENYIDQSVAVTLSPRNNNRFAFPAYYVLEVE